MMVELYQPHVDKRLKHSLRELDPTKALNSLKRCAFDEQDESR